MPIRIEFHTHEPQFDSLTFPGRSLLLLGEADRRGAVRQVFAETGGDPATREVLATWNPTAGGNGSGRWETEDGRFWEDVRGVEEG